MELITKKLGDDSENIPNTDKIAKATGNHQNKCIRLMAAWDSPK